MRIYLASLLSFLLIGCASSGSGGSVADNGPVVGSTYYTLCNLHADPSTQSLASINYIDGALIPLGTEVTIDSRNRKKMVFTVVENGVAYTWNLNRNTQTSLAENLNKFFGAAADVVDPATFSEADAEGIRLGKAMVGMTKEGVLIAVGSPPEHANPSQALGTWTYWKNRWSRRIFTFSTEGVVTEIKG